MTLNLQGRIVHIRKVSKNIMFVDIMISAPSERDKRNSLIFKFWEYPELRNKCIRGENKLHAGDIISCSGAWDKEKFSVQDYSFIERWSDSSFGDSFTPIPPDSSNSEVRKDLPCKFYVNTGQCVVENCVFKHPANLQESRREFLSAKSERRIRVHEEQFSGAELQSSCKRAELFRSWILQTYGREYLSSGTILDIAGGRGDLSFELGVQENLVCEIVDPRPTKLKRWQANIIKKTGKSLPAHHAEFFDPQFFKKTKLDPTIIRLVIGIIIIFHSNIWEKLIILREGDDFSRK